MPFDVIYNKYCGVFLVMLEPQIRYLNHKLKEIEDRIEAVCEEVKMMKDNMTKTSSDKEVLKKVLSMPENLVKLVSGFFTDTVIDFAIMFSEPLILCATGDHNTPLII